MCGEGVVISLVYGVVLGLLSSLSYIVLTKRELVALLTRVVHLCLLCRFLAVPPGDTLIILYIRRLGPFFGVQNLNFNLFWGFQKN